MVRCYLHIRCPLHQQRYSKGDWHGNTAHVSVIGAEVLELGNLFSALLSKPPRFQGKYVAKESL